jgi:cytochrome c553
LAAVAVALLVSSGFAVAGDVAAGKSRYVLCAGCHGPDGAGNAALNYPALAGRDAAYILEQLRAFKSGARTNATMRAMAAGLNARDMDNLAAYIETL